MKEVVSDIKVAHIEAEINILKKVVVLCYFFRLALL